MEIIIRKNKTLKIADKPLQYMRQTKVGTHVFYYIKNLARTLITRMSARAI